MIKEIGSEFWAAPQQQVDKHYLLSGRTALEYIVRDIKHTNAIRSVLMPSYCCHTMIEPFVRHGFAIRFYDVFFDQEAGYLRVDMPEYQTDEVLFYMSYFGFAEIEGLQLERLRKRYPVIIDDRTHSWLRQAYTEIHADYSFTSFRKWGAFSGIAEVCKYNGHFYEMAEDMYSRQYVHMRETAYAKKAQYMVHGGEKCKFLKLFGDAEALLEEDYIGYRPSYQAIDALMSTDWDAMRNRRRENAAHLMDSLSQTMQVTLPYTKLTDADAPLFVPILVDKGRNELRKYLIAHEVYCPVHWPKSVLHEGISQRASRLYDTELSLLCDQRYGQDEMRRIISLITEYYE